MKEKRIKPIIRKTYTLNKKVTCLNVSNIKAHFTDIDIPEEILKELSNSFEQVAIKHKLKGEAGLESLFKLLQIKTITLCRGDHITPKMIAHALRMLKTAISYANDLSMINGILDSRDNIRIMEEQLRVFVKDLPISYKSIPDDIRKIVTLPVELN